MDVRASSGLAIDFGSLLKYSIVVEAINEKASVHKLRRFAPKSEYEEEILRLIQRYPAPLSYGIYLFFEKMRSCDFSFDTEDKKRRQLEAFFVEAESIYALRVLFDVYRVEKDIIVKLFRGFYAISERYKAIAQTIYAYMAKENNKGYPSKDNIFSFSKTLHALNLNSDIEHIMGEIREMQKEYYGPDFFLKVTDIFSFMLENVASIGECQIRPEISSNEGATFLLSCNPPVWVNYDMTKENLLSQFILKFVDQEAYKIATFKNLFYYFLSKPRSIKRNYFAKRIGDIFIRDEIETLEILEKLDSIFSENNNKTRIYQEFMSFVNMKQLADPLLHQKIAEIFKIDKVKAYSEQELTSMLSGAIYQAGALFAFDENAFLFYDDLIKDDKKIILQLAELIEKSFKRDNA